MSPRVRGKRAFDVAVAVAALVLLAPVLAVVWCLVKFSSRGPAIYRGQRVGLNGVDFEILKFRSMRVGGSSQLTTALDDPRVTRVGRFLRRYKLDELPQLVNVIRGDMSIVGPRPEFRQWVDLYTSEQRRVLSVRPGLTDFASLAFIDLAGHVGAEDADANYLKHAFQTKNELRLSYVDQMSWRTDLSLIGQTVMRIARRGSR